jgi:predicted hydrocarbon binding protein
MSETQGIAFSGLRVVLDSLEDSIGTHGKNAILNFAKLDQYIKNPPDFDPEKRMPTDEYQRLWSGVRVILGNKGYNSVIYRAGGTAFKEMLVKSEAVRALVENPQKADEKIVTLVTTYVYTYGLDPKVSMEHLPDEHVVYMHRPHCNECIEVSKNQEITKDITKPGCAMILGALTALTNSRPDLMKTTVEETQCKLMGAPECTFKMTYEAVS